MTTKLQIALGVLVYLAVAFFNYGFNGTDEYWVGMVKYLPAQSSEFSQIIQSDDVKLPSQILPLFYVAKLSYFLGIEDPFWQYRFVLIFFNFVLLAVCFFAIKPHTTQKNAFWLILAFHFAVPALASRLMFESLSFPWLLLSVSFGVLYDQRQERKHLLIALLGICIAFALRAQVGICALGLVALTLLKKNFKDFLLISVLGGSFFAALGFLDYFWSDQYYRTLRSAFSFNVEHGSAYSDAPWFFFFPLIFVFMFGPWLFYQWSPATFSRIKERRLAIFYLVFFLLLHMSFANKFERFLIPAFAMLIFLLEPFINEWLENYKQRWIRLISAAAFSLSIWVLVAFQPAQKSIIDVVLYLSEHPEIKEVQNFSSEIEWFPTVFAKNPIAKIENAASDKADKEFVLINQTQTVIFQELNPQCHLIKNFSVNAIDALAFHLNPEKNKRRAPLLMYHCQNQSPEKPT